MCAIDTLYSAADIACIIRLLDQENMSLIFASRIYCVIVLRQTQKSCMHNHDLRVIHLYYECDLNLQFSISFRELDQHWEDNNLINKGVYGCRPNRRAIDLVFVDVTQTEMAMVTITLLVKYNNDATACFDRIL